MQTATTLEPSVRFAGSHGYRIDGDMAVLNADLAASGMTLPGQWALQLWACDVPHAGGLLSGVKVAEAPIDLASAGSGTLQHQEAQAPLRLPAAGRDYSMVLVLASGAGGAFEQVHDFANFPERQPFVAPHFAGAVGYAIGEGDVTLRAERVRNPRAADNVSGSLALELRAIPAGQSEREPLVLATAHLGCLAGQAEREGLEERATFSPPPPGEWNMVLALVEWTALGYATRDACEFAVAYRGALAAVDSPVAILQAPVPSAAKPQLLSVQTATVDELSRVPGLTLKLALEIVKARPFASLDDLVRVRGIGPKTARKLRGALTV